MSRNQTHEKTRETGILSYFWDRIPTYNEVWNGLEYKVPMEVFLGESLKIFGKNKSSKSIIRDFLKIPGLWKNIVEGEEIGGTGYIFDESHGYALASKIVCKTSLIVVSGFTLGAVAIPMYSRAANFVCEPISQFFMKAGKERQSKGEEGDFLDYVYENLKIEWAVDSLFSSIPKVLVTDRVGELVKKYEINERITELTYTKLKPHVGEYIFDGDFSSSQSFWKNIKENIVDTSSFHLLPELFLASFIYDYVAKMASGVLLTYAFTLPARAAQDVFFEVVKIFKSDAKNASESVDGAYPSEEYDPICLNLDNIYKYYINTTPSAHDEI